MGERSSLKLCFPGLAVKTGFWVGEGCREVCLSMGFISTPALPQPVMGLGKSVGVWRGCCVSYVWIF